MWVVLHWFSFPFGDWRLQYWHIEFHWLTNWREQWVPFRFLFFVHDCDLDTFINSVGKFLTLRQRWSFNSHCNCLERFYRWAFHSDLLIGFLALFFSCEAISSCGQLCFVLDVILDRGWQTTFIERFFEADFCLTYLLSVLYLIILYSFDLPWFQDLCSLELRFTYLFLHIIVADSIFSQFEPEDLD